MKVLIIGGTGLISTYITQLLASQAVDLTLYNRGLSQAPTPPGVRLLRGDRSDRPAFEAQMREAGTFDAVIDMVAYAPQDGESAARAFRGRVGQFIFCSTVDVYLKPASRYPYTEAEGYGGLNDYAANKVVIEKRLWQAHQAGDFALTIIRPAYTYGEGRGPLHTFGGRTTYIDRLRRGKPLVVHGDGNSFWVACHASDVARSFVTALGNPRSFGRAYHTAGEEWLTWDTYHRLAAEAIGAPPPQLVHIPTDFLARVVSQQAGLALTNLQFNNIFDNSAARADLDFRYTVPWAQGARRMVDWLDAHNGVENSDLDDLEDRLAAAWQRAGSQMTGEMNA